MVIIHLEEVVSVVVRPASCLFEVPHACPGEIHAAAGYGGAVGVAAYGSFDGLDDFTVGVAADAEGSHLAETFLRRPVVDDGSQLALAAEKHFVPWSLLRGPRQPLEYRFAGAWHTCPLETLFAFLLHQVEACAAVFDAVVTEATVTLLDLATQILLH